MKKSILLSIILSLSLVACIPQAMAQKQSRMEKLLRYLNDNDADKWQKNRDKIDDETQTYYAEELALLDVLNELWNKQSEQAATNYFGCYESLFSEYLRRRENTAFQRTRQSGTGCYLHPRSIERADSL